YHDSYNDNSNIELDIKQRNIDKLIEYTVDLPDSILTTFINIIKKLVQVQFHQPEYLKMWITLLDATTQINNNKLSLGVSLLNHIRYSKGSKTSQIFSKYIQQKAYNFIKWSLYCSNNGQIKYRKLSTRKVNRLQKINISLHNKVKKFKQICKKKISLAQFAACKIPTIINKQLKLAIQDRLIINKKQYCSITVLIATQICEIGQMSYQSAVTCMKKVIK
ncbi:1719_t:CDS:1, partial [Racocetra persica]